MDDIKLPPLPDLQFKMFYRSDVLTELEAYARVAVFADRQQRGGDVEVMRQALERISGLRGTAGFERTSFMNEVQVFANEIARAALAAQPAASAEPERHKTDDELGGVLAAIRHYGGQKWAEGRGVADDDLQNVRIAWDAVYERVQALAAHKPDGGDAKVSGSALDALIDVHQELVEDNPYCYFELAHTRQTGWMAWITDKPLYPVQEVANPDRKVLARGQGESTEDACRNALAAISAQQRQGKGEQ